MFFGSTSPFGQSPSSPFIPPPMSGPTSCTGTDLFSPGAFGSPNCIGSRTVGSVFGGGFGHNASSPFAHSSGVAALGSSTPAFGRASSTSFGGSSVFGQKPAFGGFGSTPSQASPFAITFQHTQSAFGNNLCGSTPCGALSQSDFGSSSSPSFGCSSIPGFGATTTSTFCATTTPAFGDTTTPIFSSTTPPAYGSTTTVMVGSTEGFRISSNPSFGSSVTPAFGAPSISLLGSSSTQAYGASSTSAFGSSFTPAFGSSTSPSFGFVLSPSFSQSTSTFGNMLFGTAPSSFGTQTSPFGTQTPPPTLGNPGFGQLNPGGQLGGSRVMAYTRTAESDGSSGTQPAGKLESISAMPLYRDKSHEELRCEDCQRGDKGGPNPSGLPSVGISFPTATRTNTFGPTGTSGFGSSSTPIFSTPFSSGPIGSNPFITPSTRFGLFRTSTPSILLPTGNSAGFGQANFPTSAIGQTPSLFDQPSTGFQQTTPSLGSNPFGTPSTGFGLFRTSTPSILPTVNPAGFGQANFPTSAIGQTPSLFEQPSTGFQQTTPSLGSNPFGTPSTGFGLFRTSTPLILPTGNPAGFGQANFPTSAIGQTPSLFEQPSTGFQQTTPSLGSNPFGTPSTGFGLFRTSTPSIQPTGNPAGFGQANFPTSAIGQTPSLFGKPSTGFQQTTPSLGSNPFSPPSTGSGGLFRTSTPLILPTGNPAGFDKTNSSPSTAFQQAAPAPTSSALSLSNYAFSGGFSSMSNKFNQGSLVQLCLTTVALTVVAVLIWSLFLLVCFSAATQADIVVQPSPITNPFGTLPAMPQTSIGRAGSAPSVDYGISSILIAEKPNPIGVSSLLTSRHLSKRRIRLPARRHHPKSDGQRVPFFMDDEAAPTTPRTDALFIPWENRRVLIIHPIEQWPSRNTEGKQSMPKEIHPPTENGEVSEQLHVPDFDESIAAADCHDSPAEDGHIGERSNAPPSPSEPTQMLNGVHADLAQTGTGSSYITFSGRRAGEEASILYEHGADIEVLMHRDGIGRGGSHVPTAMNSVGGGGSNVALI